MKKKTCYLFIFDGFADWEASYATIGITKSEYYQLKTIAIDKIKKESMGGVTVMPDYDFIPQVDLDDINSNNTGLVILPGGAAWEQKTNQRIAPLVKHCIENDIPVAAICGATILLADGGWLDRIAHTSNDLAYLQAFSSSYNGRDFYLREPSVRSGSILTASGTAAIQFAKDIFEVLEIAEDPSVREWFQYFDVQVSDLSSTKSPMPNA